MPPCPADGAVPIPHLYRHPAKLPAPQGSHYSIAAGERSEPAEGGLPPPSAPRGSNARRVCPAPASFRVAALHRSAAVAGCAERMPVRPPWGRTYICVALRPRVRHAHPRLQSSSGPLGAAVPVAIPLQNRWSDAIPAACRGGIAVLMPHLYRHPAMLPAPQGSHYSIAAGERSEPAESGLHHHRPQGGRTPYVRVLRRHPFGWQLSTACCRGWLCRAYARSTPLGPYIYMYGSSSAGSPCSPAEGRTSLSCHLA